MTDEVVPTFAASRFVVFTLAEEEFAVDVAQVQEIIEMQEVTRVPRAPEFVKGVLNLRGKILPVMDLRERLGLPPASEAPQRIVVAQLGDQVVGMMVDSVVEVLPLPESSIEPPPALVADVSATYLQGLARLENRLLILLDLEGILDVQELQQLAGGPGGEKQEGTKEEE